MMRLALTRLALTRSWLIVPLACTGCAALKAERPTTLRLAPAVPVAAALKPAPSLTVAAVQARGLAGAQRYAYVAADAPAEIRQAATLFWEEPPPEVLTRALVQGLRARFAQVSGPEARLPAERRVVATLDRFEERAAGGAAQAFVGFDVVITGPAPMSGRYCGSAPIADASGSGRAHAFEAAIGAAVDGFVQDAAADRLRAGAC